MTAMVKRAAISARDRSIKNNEDSLIDCAVLLKDVCTEYKRAKGAKAIKGICKYLLRRLESDRYILDVATLCADNNISLAGFKFEEKLELLLFTLYTPIKVSYDKCYSLSAKELSVLSNFDNDYVFKKVLHDTGKDKESFISVLKEFNRLDVLHIDLNSMYNNNVSSDVINESIIPVIRFLLEAEFDGVVPVDMLYNLYSLDDFLKDKPSVAKSLARDVDSIIRFYKSI